VPSDLVVAFSRAVVSRLVAAGQLAIAAGATEDDVARQVAVWLDTRGRGRSLVSATSAALVAAPSGDEVYADDDALMGVIDDLGEPR
jgi:hypothetical protein